MDEVNRDNSALMKCFDKCRAMFYDLRLELPVVRSGS